MLLPSKNGDLGLGVAGEVAVIYKPVMDGSTVPIDRLPLTRSLNVSLGAKLDVAASSVLTY